MFEDLDSPCWPAERCLVWAVLHTSLHYNWQQTCFCTILPNVISLSRKKMMRRFLKSVFWGEFKVFLSCWVCSDTTLKHATALCIDTNSQSTWCFMQMVLQQLTGHVLLKSEQLLCVFHWILKSRPRHPTPLATHAFNYSLNLWTHPVCVSISPLHFPRCWNSFCVPTWTSWAPFLKSQNCTGITDLS